MVLKPLQDPYVLVDAVEAQVKDDRIRSIVEELADSETDGVCLSLFRTDFLVSSIHRSEEADRLRRYEIDRETFRDLHHQFDDEEFDVTATIYDPELLDWYENTVDTRFFCLDPADITYKRLIKKAAQTDQTKPQNRQRYELRSTGSMGPERLSYSTMSTLILNPVTSSDYRPYKISMRPITDWLTPREVTVSSTTPAVPEYQSGSLGLHQPRTRTDTNPITLKIWWRMSNKRTRRHLLLLKRETGRSLIATGPISVSTDVV